MMYILHCLIYNIIMMYILHILQSEWLSVQ